MKELTKHVNLDLGSSCDSHPSCCNNGGGGGDTTQWTPSNFGILDRAQVFLKTSTISRLCFCRMAETAEGFVCVKLISHHHSSKGDSIIPI